MENGMTVVVLAPVIVLAFALIIVGIIAHGKRINIYDEYKPYFGWFKAYMFLTFLLFGAFATWFGIVSLFGKNGIGSGLLTILLGLVCIACGVLLGYFTNKKAMADGKTGAIKNMILAGCGTFWHVELVIIKICCFIWLIKALTDRKERY